MPETNTKTHADAKVLDRLRHHGVSFGCRIARARVASQGRRPLSACGCVPLDRSKPIVLLLTLCMLAGISAQAEDNASYARKCNKEVGAAVEGFNCNDGTEIPMDATTGETCKKPPYLTSARCRNGSRLKVQKLDPPNDNIAIVWLCRKKDVTDPTSNKFDDIAVIQTNYENGATCFYQHLGEIDGTNVPPPELDKTNFWMSPHDAAEEECASCHDTGLLRTPYLTQVKVLPEKIHRLNYWFPGDDFDDWNGKVYRVTGAAASACTSCHKMGANKIDVRYGTSTWLGLMATGVNPTPNLTPPGLASWMTPKRIKPKHDEEAAKMIAKCARGENVPDCKLELWGGQMNAPLHSEPKLPRLMQPPPKDSKAHAAH